MVYREVKCRIVPGEIVVNDGVEVPGKYKVLVFDLVSKYAEILSWGCEDNYPTIQLWADEDTLNVDELKKGYPTELKFTAHKGWRVLSASIGRYTLTVVLEKDKP